MFRELINSELNLEVPDVETVFEWFQESKYSPEIDIIYGYYLEEDYTGDAFVLFLQDGKLYEVSGYHCSCYGLEEQWKPEETSIKALRFRGDKRVNPNAHEWETGIKILDWLESKGVC